MKVLSCEQTRELEQKAVEAGTSYLALMENAGGAAARFLIKKDRVSEKNVVVLCGRGNNGGDGFVIARLLSEKGAKVTAVLVQGHPGTEISKEMYERMKETPTQILYWPEDSFRITNMVKQADFLVDAIYGIGFHGSISSELFPLLDAVEASRAHILAIDVPSGAQGDSGAVEGRCIYAQDTITFSTLKPVHLLQPAKSYCGKVTVAPVGITAQLIDAQESFFQTTEIEEVKKIFSPRKEDSNKGSFGTLFSLCGSSGMAGAAIMSAAAALRCGVGLLNLAIPAQLYPIAASRLLEPVYTILEDSPCGLLPLNKTKIEKALKRATACLIGCGLGSGSATASLIYDLLSRLQIPVVLDADGINAVAANIDILKAVQVPLIMTPHPGEMARLLNTSVADVQANRLSYSKKFAQKYHVILVLKGSGTVIAAPDGKTYMNLTGNPGMATGGSGDVLAGMIASFLAQGTEPFQAAVCGVYLHGLAGDRCAQKFSQRAMLPTDIIAELPSLFSQFE